MDFSPMVLGAKLKDKKKQCMAFVASALKVAV